MRTQIEIQKLEQQFEFEVSMTFEFNNAEMGVSLFNPHAPVAQNMRISGDSSLIKQKIGILLYKIM